MDVLKLTAKPNYLTFLSLFYFMTAIFIFGFGSSYQELGIKGEKTFTVSNSLEYGRTEYIVTCLSISFFFTYLLLKKKGLHYVNTRLILLFISFVFLILLCWYTPTKYNDIHNIFTGIIIVSLISFLILTYYNLYMYYKKYITYISIFLFILVTAMFIIGLNSIEKGDIYTDIFAVLELILIFVYIYTIILIGLC